jgi:glucose/arabinose dehydrogenase
MIGLRLSRSIQTIAFLFILSALGATVTGATLPTGFTEALVASGLSNPTAMQFAPDGRLFVSEQQGRIRIIENGVLLSTPFLTLTVRSSGERGLMGVAFDPAFATNQFVYVYYTATTPAIHNRVSRFTANGNVAVPGSETIIIDLDNLSSATNHNGGAIHFGPDGKLYIATGENGNSANAQSLNTVLGKILRLSKDGTIPTDNPFFTSTTGKNRAIWALGLRNPFTFAFRPFAGDLYINDVGETSWEEINDGMAGANYGWPDTEGSTTNPNFKTPRVAYSHSNGACAITGGAFYAPMTAQFPTDYANDYFFADYCAGWIRQLDAAAGAVTTFATGLAAPVDLKVADDGSLYYLARGSGSVFRIQYGAAGPSITLHPSSQTVAPGASVTFSVRASGPAPLRYRWQRNGIDIPGATAQDYTIASVVAGDNGARFRANVSNDFSPSGVFSNEAILTVSGNEPPTGTILQPSVGTLYSGGSVITYNGTGTDSNDGTLPASAFTWQVDFHHDTHIHPFMPATTGSKSGSFTIPTTGETSANVWYRIYLTVRDSAGLTHTSQRDILPRKATLTLATNPAGLQLRLDGQPAASPISFESVVGIVRTLDAPTPQSAGGTTYNFTTWSDGGVATHSLSTPSTNTTYTATYQAGAAAGSIALVQHASRDAGSTASATLAYPTSNSAGNWNGVVVRAAGLNQVLTISDSNGNQYRKAAQFNVTLDGVTLAVFYAENIKAGVNTIQVTNTQSGTLRIAILEYRGVATANSLDQAGSGEGTSAAPATSTATTTTNGELVIGAIMTADPASVTAGSGFTMREAVPSNSTAKLVVEERVQPVAGPVAATGTLASAGVWGAVLATFKPASAGPAPPGAPASPAPADGATNVSTATALSWSATNTTSYDIYFGPNNPPPVVVANSTTPTYTPPTLANSATYFWKVVARNSGGTTDGPVWRFTTAPAASPLSIALVQRASKDAGTTASTTLAFPAANAAGHFIAVAIRAGGLNQTLTITDSNGNQYRKAVQFNVTLDGVTLAIFYAENIKAGMNTIGVASAQSGTLRLSILEYSGVATANSLDVTSAAQGTSASPNAGTVATTANGDLLIGAVMTANSAAMTAGSGWTLRDTVPASPNAKLAVEDTVQTTAGTKAATAALSNPDTWGVVFAAFRAASQ